MFLERRLRVMNSTPQWFNLSRLALSGQLGVKNEFLGEMTGALFPELGKVEDLVILVFFAKIGIAVAKDLGG